MTRMVREVVGMTSFRSARSQATHALREKIALGESRHTAKKSGAASAKIYSFGTLRNYTQALTQAAQWYCEQARAGRAGFDGRIGSITIDQAREYLVIRATSVGQKQLDLDRQSLEKVIGERLQHIKSLAERVDRLANQPRAYSPAQVVAIAKHQNGTNALATEIAWGAGLRAHELLTLARTDERPPDTHRSFRPDIFAGFDNFQRYTVIGKGGLIREVAIPSAIAGRLELTRHSSPLGVRDRRIWYQQQYAIGGGQAWSQSFTSASYQVLGWSTGAHGLRHSYAQARLERLQRIGFSWADALEIVSQEMGHFRKDVTETYLR